MNQNKDLKTRIIEISRNLKLSHIGSCLSILSLLDEIYAKKKVFDRVILDCAHAHLAHLIVRDNIIGDNIYSQSIIEEIIKDFGIHCDKKAGCDASGGSLGHGLGIGIGMALVNRGKDIYCIVSDGSMQEGSNWEALRIKKQLRLKNLKIYCNFNGYTAIAKINRNNLVKQMRVFCDDIEVRYTKNGKGFDGIQGHYRVL